jgi:hypothetical protein
LEFEEKEKNARFMSGIFYGCKRQSSIPLKKTARAGVILLHEKEGIGVQPLSQQKTPARRKMEV